MKWFVRLLKVAYIALIAALPVAAMADYLATAGSGLTFGSIDLAGIKFPTFIGCDPTTAKQCWSISASGAVKVDNSAVTQPVNGTVTANLGTLNGAATAAGVAAVNTTLGTPFQAGGALAANQSVNFNQYAGNAVTCTMTAYGTAPTGNCPGFNTFVTNATPGIANNADGIAAVAAGTTSPVPVNGYNYVFNGTTWDRLRSGTQTGSVAIASGDPCLGANKTNFTISTTSGTVQLVAPSGSTQVYICSLITVGATASIQNLVGGTGATCTTGTPVAMAGSTTAANGMSFAATSGFTFGNGGGTVLRTTTGGHGVCLIQSATAQISGGGTFVQQ